MNIPDRLMQGSAAGLSGFVAFVALMLPYGELGASYPQWVGISAIVVLVCSAILCIATLAYGSTNNRIINTVARIAIVCVSLVVILGDTFIVFPMSNSWGLVVLVVALVTILGIGAGFINVKTT